MTVLPWSGAVVHYFGTGAEMNIQEFAIEHCLNSWGTHSQFFRVTAASFFAGRFGISEQTRLRLDRI
jgi:hypothetical protein